MWVNRLNRPPRRAGRCGYGHTGVLASRSALTRGRASPRSRAGRADPRSHAAWRRVVVAGNALMIAMASGHRDGALLGLDARAELHGIGLRELGAEEEDDRRVVDPDQQDDERSGGAERRADVGAPEVEADQDLADVEEQRGERAADQGVLPAHPPV